MGSPVSPIVANLFMENFETNALLSFGHEVKFWARYVDDTFCIIKKEYLEDFTHHLNSCHDKIKFTVEEENNQCLPMLDVNVKKNEAGKLSFGVYRKKTHTDQYLQFTSHQPLEHKIGVVRTLQHRAKHHVSNIEDLEIETNHLKKVLAISEYPSWIWDQPASKKKNQQEKEKARKIIGHVTLPYVQGTSEALARRMRANGIMVHLKPHTKLRDLLVKPKDKTTDMEKSDVIYKIDCGECNANYVGETGRLLKLRVKEHQRSNSPVFEHSQNTGHRMRLDETKVLERESDWFKRGVKEAIHIQANNSNLNRDRGRHHLPTIYRQLIPQLTGSRDNIWGIPSEPQEGTPGIPL